MKVFHGITGSAGQPSCLTSALREIGIDADAYCVNRSKFGYGADRFIGSDTSKPEYSKTLEEVSKEYDVFHFYFRSFWFRKVTLDFPTGLDLVALRAQNKKVIINFRGSEARLHSLFKKYSPYNYVDENPDGLVTKFPEESQKKYIDFAKGVASHILVPDPELQSYVPGSVIVPRGIDLKKWDNVGISYGNKKPLVIHAPSRRGVKGTSHVFQAVKELREEGFDFDFQLVENMENDAARALYQRADIVIDQLRIGWYGVLAAECMALGKPVISYVRDDLLGYFNEDLPLHVANPLNIKEKLEELITDEALRRHYSVKSRKFCENEHDSIKVAEKLVDVYNSKSPPLSMTAFNQLIRHQEAVTKNKIKEARKNTLPPFKDIKVDLNLLKTVWITIKEKGILGTIKLTKEKLKRVKIVVIE